MSLINREKAIQKFQSYQRDCEEANDDNSASVFADAITELEGMPDESQRWISVNELPEEDQQVLVYMPRTPNDDCWHEIREAWYDNFDGSFYIPATSEKFLVSPTGCPYRILQKSDCNFLSNAA